MRLLIFCLILLLIPHSIIRSSTETHLEFEKLTMDDGLSSNMTTCVFKDSRGFMWFGTQNGLNRYDAYKFETWKHIPGKEGGLPDNSINDIEEGADGIIWIGTKNGLCSYNYGTNKIKAFAIDIQSYIPSPKALINIKDIDYFDNELYIASSVGAFVLDVENINKVKVKCFIDLNYGKSYPAVSIAFQPEVKKIWVSTYGMGLFRVSDDPDKGILGKNTKVADGTFNQLLLTTDNRVLAATQKQGLIEYDIKTNVVTRHTFSKKNDIPETYDIFLSKNGNLWISQGHELIKCSPDLREYNVFRYDSKNTKGRLPGIIMDIYCDDEGICWFANNYFGINVLDENAQPFKRFFVSTGNINDNKNFVKDIALAQNSERWVATFGNGIKVYDEEDKLLRSIRLPASGELENIIFDILFCNNDEIWVAAANGLFVFDNNKKRWTNKFTTSNGLWHNQVNKLVEDSRGNIWIATREGLNKYVRNKDSIIKISMDDGLVHYKINDFSQDTLGNLWIATYEGISVYDLDKEEFTNIVQSNKPTKGLSNSYVNDVYIDKENIAWIGTENGLNKYDPKTEVFSWYFEEDGLISNNINAIMADNHENIWLLTPYGVSVTNHGLTNFENYNHLDGLFSFTNPILAYKRKIFIGGSNTGYYVINPDSIQLNNSPPPVHITEINSLSSDSGRIIPGAPLVFKYAERHILIRFAALNYSSPEKNQYAYRLEGLNDDWVYPSSNKREVVFNNLSPGSYLFRVKASNNNNVWNETGDTIAFEILPPWWLSSWAYAIYLVMFIVFSFVIYKLRKQREHLISNMQKAKAQVEIQQMQVQLQEEANELKLKYFTDVSHEFRTPLSLISGPVEMALSDPSLSNPVRDKLKLADKNIERLKKLVTQLLDYRKITGKKIKPVFEPLEMVGFIKSIFSVFNALVIKKNIAYVFQSNVDEFIGLFDKDILEKIIYNLVSNAFKNTPENGEINFKLNLNSTIGVVKHDDMEDDNKTTPYLMEITISNTGKGIAPEYFNKIFDRFYQIPRNNEKIVEGSGIGLSMIKEYVDFLGGKIKLESEQNKITTFYLSFNLQQVHIHNTDINQGSKTDIHEQDIETETDILESDIKNVADQNNKSLLIVEDNLDLRKVLKELFSDSFSIVEAENGKTGLEKSVSLIPDIIISDVMMPEMDGEEFCRRCKKGEFTSHIPVVLLTAKSGEQDKLAGYQTGADAYFTKPFSPAILKAFILNLVENREKLKKIYAENYFNHMDRMFTTPGEKKFIDKVVQILKENIEDETFNVTSLSHLLDTNPTQLYRKFKGHLGVSPSSYIRNFRMNIAAKMLTNTEMNVSEIAYKVGIKHHASFTRLFQQQFGVSPSRFKEINT